MQNRQVNIRLLGGTGGGRHKGLCQKIISAENLFLAWLEFKRGKIKKPEIREYGFYLERNIFYLRDRLKVGQYTHGSYQSFYVYDPKRRLINKASVEDSLVHQAIFRILSPIFDKQFIYDSYSCRVDKGVHLAVNNLVKYARRASGNYNHQIYYLKCDVKKFFANIDHGILESLINTKIDDSSALEIVKKVLQSYEELPGIGLPLGNVTSQLFANIYLNELDRYVKHNLIIKHYLRYCDDFIILHKDQDYLKGLVPRLRDYLATRLKLQLHPDKIIISKFERGIDFLGYVVRPYHLVVRTKTKKRMVRLVSDRNITSYLGICKHAQARGIEKAILEKVNDDK